MNPEQRQLGTHRALLLWGGGAYLTWWAVVQLTLPTAFNPLGSRLAAVACFFAVYGASYASTAVARQLDGWLAGCATVATAHYFYLFDRNYTDLNWAVGSYITVAACCAILQTARALLGYSLGVAALSVALLVHQPQLSYVVFLPGLLTLLAFANAGLRARFKLHQRLRESHARIESLFDAGFDGIAVHERGTIRQVNGALGALVGYAKDELEGRPMSMLLGAEALKVIAELDAGAGGAPREVHVLKKDGTSVTVEVLAKRHVLDGREMQQLALRDLTERKRAELELVRANRGLESFSYSVAHDLRAPLRAINGFSQILLEDYAGQLADEGKRQLGRIATAAETMGQLIDALLDLSRISRSEVQRDRVNLSEHAEALAKQLQAGQPERAVEFTSQPNVIAQGDPRLLRTVLGNLLGNAWKFTEHKRPARVEFGCTMQGSTAVYFVRDNGAGFDMAHAGKLFAPFQRLHSHGEFPGTGIGLATVQRIVDSHGGRVWAESEVGQGATFFFTLESALAATG